MHLDRSDHYGLPECAAIRLLFIVSAGKNSEPTGPSMLAATQRQRRRRPSSFFFSFSLQARKPGTERKKKSSSLRSCLPVETTTPVRGTTYIHVYVSYMRTAAVGRTSLPSSYILHD